MTKSTEFSPSSDVLLSKLSSMLYSPTPKGKENRSNSKHKPVREPPSVLMKQRWEQVVISHVPYVDQSDVFALDGVSRQFAAEYAQLVYVNMLRSEQVIGNYF